MLVVLSVQGVSKTWTFFENATTSSFMKETFLNFCGCCKLKTPLLGGGRVMRRCWVNFQCQGVLLTWLTVGQGPIVLSVGAGGGCLDIFSLIFHFSFLSPSLWETARYRLKYCLKGPLSQKPTNQQPFCWNEDLLSGGAAYRT